MRRCVASERDDSGEAAGGDDGGGGEGDTTVPGGGEEVGRGGDGGGDGSTGSRSMPLSVMGVATPPQMVLKAVQYEMFSGVPPILPP